MFVDFSEFREGPNGTPLLQLLYALNGQPLPPEAIELAARVDAETRDSQALIRAARSVGQKERLLELTHRNILAWQTSPSLLCQVIGGSHIVEGNRERAARRGAVPQRLSASHPAATIAGPGAGPERRTGRKRN